jgi:hypothetical protein
MNEEIPDVWLGRDLAVYEWKAWDGFFVKILFPKATHIPATLDDSAADVLGRVPADCRLFLSHIDLSRTDRLPPDREALLAGLEARGIRVLNRALGDIRKSSLRRLLAGAGLSSAAACEEGDGDETLIIKTDCNYGGLHERTLTPEQRERLGLPAREPGLASWSDYRVLPRAEVLPEWWRDETLVVERFIENPAGEFFRVCIAGESVVVIRAYSQAQIKKVTAGPRDKNFLIRRERLPHLQDNGYLSPSLLETIARLLDHAELDFGTLDIVHEGDDRFYIIDLNPTPYGSRQGWLPDAVSRHLRAGLFPTE